MIDLPSVKKVALIVHDMHNDNLKAGGGNPNAEKASKDPAVQKFIANNVRLLETARKRGMAVFHTGHFLRADYIDAVPNAPSARMGTLRDGTWGAQPIDELAPAEGEWLIRKGGGYSAFTGTALDKWLRRLGITHIIIGGAGTHAGVEATVRDFREHDYRGIIASDACSGAGSPNHAASMLILNFAQIGTTDEVLEAMENAPA